MRLLVKILFIAWVFTPAFIHAQKSKVGYINTNELWAVMPEKPKADSLFSFKQQEYQDRFNRMQTELNDKVAMYDLDSLQLADPVIFKHHLEELKSLQQRTEEFQKDATGSLQEYKDALYKPIRARMQEAIDSVAEEGKYDFILDSSFGNIVYRRQESDNILPLVLDELGIEIETD